MALFVVVVVVVVASSSSLLLRFFFGVALDDDDGVLLFRRTFISFVVRSTREQRRTREGARALLEQSENFFPISFVREKLQLFSFPGDENMRYLPIK